MKLLRILTLLTAGTTLLSPPARANDHDKDHDHDKNHKKYAAQYDRDYRPRGILGFDGQRRHYYGSSATVIVERERPVYYGRQSYDDRPSYSSQSVEIDVQRGLARRGYYRGPIDGDIGPGSRASIRAFQSDNGFAPTGRIDRGLLEALR